MNKKILITGANGLIGSRLTEILLARHYRVAWLVRPGSRKPRYNVETYHWDVARQSISAGAFAGVDAVVHLAGANIGEKRWSDERKQEIIKSRTESADLLVNCLSRTQHQVKSVIAASAIGYYGNTFNGDIAKETDAPGHGFQAEVTVEWESHLNAFAHVPGIRLAILRTGVVLSDRGGAFPQLVRPVKMGVGSLGTGTQPISWIHIDDIAHAYLYAIENEHVDGVYNAVAPEPVTNAEMVEAIAKDLGRGLLIKRVPSFLVRTMLGEMSQLVLGGARVSSQKLRVGGFQFRYATIQEALEDLLPKL